MAKKKEPPKPLLATKFDFVDSLNHFISTSVMLINAIDMVMDVGEMPEKLRGALKERADAFRKALFTED